MSDNKIQLAKELIQDPKTIHQYLDNLESEQDLNAELFRNHTSKMSAHSLKKKANMEELASAHLGRDDAFFKYMRNARQIKSQISVLNHFEQAINKPAFAMKDTKHMLSFLDTYDKNIVNKIAHIEEYYQSKANYLDEIQRLNMTLLDLSVRIVQNVIPRFLYFLLQYFPFVITAYRFFYPENKLDESIQLGFELAQEYTKTQNLMDEEEKKFDEQWRDTQMEYEQVTRQDLDKLKDTQQTYVRLHEKFMTMQSIIEKNPNSDLKNTYTRFQQHPSSAHLLDLVTAISQIKFDDSLRGQTHNHPLDKVIHTLQELYPEVGDQLERFDQENTAHLSAQYRLRLIEQRGIEVEKNNKTLFAKIKRIKAEYDTLTEKKAEYERLKSLNPTLSLKSLMAIPGTIMDMPTIEARIKELEPDLERDIELLKKRHQYIKLLKEFYQTRSGESLINLYHYTTDPQNIEFSDTARYLKSLYPASIAKLEEEQEIELFTYPGDEKTRLYLEYLKELVTIEKSTDPDLQSYKVLATALKKFLSQPTWENLRALQSGIKQNPNYYQEQPHLARLIDELMKLAMTSKKLQKKAERPPVKASVPKESTRPAFFQAQDKKEQNVINSIISQMLKNINAYRITNMGGEIEPQVPYGALCDLRDTIIEYSKIINGDHSNLSDDHRRLMEDIIQFMQQITQGNQSINYENISLKNIQNILEKLNQLDVKHPIRQAVQFAIEILQNNKKYLAIDTKPAQLKFQQQFEAEWDTYENALQRYEDMEGREKYLAQLSNAETADRWTHVNAINSLIRDYIKDLENHASPANADECKQLNVLKTKLTNVYQLIRYSRSPEQYVRIQTELTDLHHTLEEQFKNVDHPFKEAIEHSVEILEIICKEEGKTLTPQGPKRK